LPLPLAPSVLPIAVPGRSALMVLLLPGTTVRPVAPGTPGVWLAVAPPILFGEPDRAGLPLVFGVPSGAWSAVADPGVCAKTAADGSAKTDAARIIERKDGAILVFLSEL
jgi:hypothetical protein